MSVYTRDEEWTLLKSQGVYMLLMAGMEPKDVASLAETTEGDLSSKVGSFPGKINGDTYDLQSIVGLFPEAFFVTYESVKGAAFSSHPDFHLQAQGTSSHVRVSSEDLKDYLRRVGTLYVTARPNDPAKISKKIK